MWCGWTWVGLPGGGVEGRSTAPECARRKPATVSCRQRIPLEPGGPHAGNGGGQQQRQRQVPAPNLRKRRAAEHILGRGGEPGNIEVRDIAVRAVGEQAGRRVKIPAQPPDRLTIRRGIKAQIRRSDSW